MTQNIVTYIKVLAADKNLNPEDIFIALELALATVTEKTFDEDVHLQCAIDRETGASSYHRVWTVVADDYEDFNTARHIKLSDTEKDYEGLEVDDNIIEDIEININAEESGTEVGRIEIEKAKQVMLRAVRDAERAHNAREYESLIHTLISGEVTHVTRNAVLLDTGNVQAEITRSELIPKEIIRKGDRIMGCLVEINYHGRGALLQLSRRCPEMLEALFKQEVPEIQEGLIQVKCAARDPGSRAKIAVKSNDLRIDPIGACIGVKGSRVQAISNELHGERVDIIKWDDDPAMLAINALSPATINAIEVNESQKIMHIAIEDEMLSKAIGRNGQNINLASQLVGLKLKIISASEATEKQQAEIDKTIELFSTQLDVDNNVAEALAREGIKSMTELVNTSPKTIAKIDGFAIDIAEELISRAQGHLLEMALEDDDGSLMSVDGMDTATAEKLKEHDIQDKESLADMSVSEVTDLINISEEQAGKLILAARSHWFSDDNK